VLPEGRFMDDPLLLKAAVIALIPVGLSIGICFFVLAYLRLQAIRGKDVARATRAVTVLIGLLFALFVGIFAAAQWLLNR
jgi:hypothetical protein